MNDIPKWQKESVNAFLYDCSDLFYEARGEPQDGVYMREMIDNPKKRDKQMWPEFVEYCTEAFEDLLNS